MTEPAPASPSERALAVLKDGGREIALHALGVAYDQARRALQSGDLTPIYERRPELDPLAAALLRHQLVAAAWEDKDARDAARDEAFREGVEEIAKAALRIAFGGLVAIL